MADELADLIMVPRALVDAVRDHHTADPELATAWLEFVRWRAHSQITPDVLGNVANRLEHCCKLIQHACSDLAQVTSLLRNQHPQLLAKGDLVQHPVPVAGTTR